ncbi:MAG: hypothetical protein IK083_01690 [Abditibacteriota bacterium]|nr:hypothetical protein [Abditibacteriota bacterium]
MASHATLSVYVLETLLIFFILLRIFQARGGRELFIRRISGLNAIDEAIGRSTEMGKPLLYCFGMSGFGIVGLQSLAIMSHIARRSAVFGSRLVSAYSDSLLLAAGNEVTKEAYEEMGVPDLYDPENSKYLSDNQFAYTSAVVGLTHREKPASVVYMGYFAGEALILTENGQQQGAIQIAGTPETIQVPFFLASCDYTIIGDEYFAAAAYLSREPTMLGSLSGQDLGKATLALFIIVGALLSTLSALGIDNSIINMLLGSLFAYNGV